MRHYFTAWAVHVFTASAAFIGVLTLNAIHQHEYLIAFWLMMITVAIDSLDGTFARQVGVSKILPRMDGALLDNLVDFVNYVITPCFFLLVNPDILPRQHALWVIIMICMTSGYQFCQTDAKTADHFFKGFPCYWNFAVFYLFILHTSTFANICTLIILSMLIFVPIKYVYPSRLDYLTRSLPLKILMHLCSLTYGICSSMILWYYPNYSPELLVVSLGYVALYLALSIYRTFVPMVNLPPQQESAS